MLRRRSRSATVHQGAGGGPPPRDTREGWCYQHVQAIAVAIDQYAAKAYGNLEYFLNRPQSIGGSRKDHIP